MIVGAAVGMGLLPAVSLGGAQPAAADEGRVAPAALSEEAAIREAKRSGQEVEVVSRRGESREVFATPEGNLEAREHLRPVWTRSDGEWKRIDTALSRREDGSVVPAATAVQLQFSGGGDKAPLVRMERAGRAASLSWPGKLPAPELNGAVAIYPSVLPGVDLRMTAQEDGFAQMLVVKTAAAAHSVELNELRLKLGTEGLDVKETSDGGLRAVDRGAGGAVFEAPRPMMWDSSPGDAAAPTALRATASDTGSADREEPGATESGQLAPVGVEVTAEDELVLTPDTEVLRGDKTEYPVFIDPQWSSPRATAWTMVSKYWASSPQWKFNGDSDSGMGYCGWTYCKPQDTKRLFYQIPVSTFAGKTILSAEFVVRNTWSASCSARSVELWQTKGISSSTTWNTQTASGFWTKELSSKSFAYGYDGCSAKDAEFNVKTAVQSAANAKASTMTFGLRAGSESDAYGWKRFSNKAFLRVQYNRPPPQIKMSQLTMEYGGACKVPASAARIRTLGKIYANNVTDPDADNVRVQFQAKWDTGDGKGSIARWTTTTTYKKSGSTFAVTLPSTVPKNKSVNWYARSHDGSNYSPWSYAGDPTGCYFVYDTGVPAAPSITSGEYPASNPEDPDDPWWDGVGQYGTFALKSSSTDVNRYRWNLNGDPISANQITTTGGAAKSVDVLPAKPGLNFVTAQSFDTAGNGSEIRTYQFRVKAGQPERASWQMNDAADAREASGGSGARNAALHGGATLGADGVKGGALHLDGTSGYAETDIPTVNTANGFSISTWVKLDRIPDGAAVVATQPGNYGPGFELYYSKGYDRWVFNQYTSDAPGAGIARAMADTPGGVSVGKWTHLVGVYSGGDRELRLYVDNTLVGSKPYTTAWNARRGLQLGAAKLNGVVKNFVPGALDEVRIFDKPVSATEVGRLFRHESIGNGRTARAVFPLDEPAGSTEVIGRADTQPLTLVGDAKLGAPGIAGTALQLDGAGDYARTSAPHVDTQRAFTVSAWAKLDQVPSQAATVVAQLGTNRPGFELYYSKTSNRWGFTQYSADVPGASQIRAVQPEGTTARVGEWVHLVGVHDPTADTLTLYVNGVKAATVAQSKPFYAGGKVQVGALDIDGGQRIQYFPGTIDDVRFFDRVMAPAEVNQLFVQRPLVMGRWNFETIQGGSPATTPDLSAIGTPMTLGGQARQGAGWVDLQGLELDGAADYAATSSQPLDTSASFTVTAWAQAAAIPDGTASVMSAAGTHTSAFDLRFEPDGKDPVGLGRYTAAIRDRDTSAPGERLVSNTEFYDGRDWNHLALVYDGFTKEARLYTNGVLQESACADEDGNGDADESTCQDLIAWADNVLSFKAGGALQVGRARADDAWGQYFPGVIDDVWAFQGVLNDSQVNELAGSFIDIPTDVPSGS
ncbi:LamG-like jellyroll fold domain-containing protein [Streptomyces halstedii]|uniref:LamG-like jellyroll fold domain-containing protein n=2 Tax=Streptomyces TaxID=1883 RepID=UPI003812B73D